MGGARNGLVVSIMDLGQNMLRAALLEDDDTGQVRPVRKVSSAVSAWPARATMRAMWVSAFTFLASRLRMAW
jgi:hypothetical protein